MIKDAIYYAKVLLFGEYGIIEDSMGLSIPCNFYQGKFLFGLESEKAKNSNKHLGVYLEHLQSQQASGELPTELDLTRFQSDIDKGLHFDSSIPQGYGVGSSGALVAAIYENYAVNPISSETKLTPKRLSKLKQTFGALESYFHGTSSGLDPLICYLNLPVVIDSKSDLNTTHIPTGETGNGAIFLLNSGQPGETQPMVQIFLEKCKQEGFRNMMKGQFKKYNDECINAFINKEKPKLFTNLKQLSKLLLDNFKPMIPSSFHGLWKQGIETNAYYLKLCGSGGGGYMLGFTKDLAKAEKMLKGHNLEVIHRF